MTYKETLFFVAQCLTINHEEHNKLIIENQLKSENIDWDNVVKISTAHFVFPALYCNLKKAGFLYYLPDDLVEYMKHITDLNRERNQQIIEQAKEINRLLLANNITPIFLKGTGNVLEGLYDDIAERMVGDIDFIVDKKNYDKAYAILLEDKYSKVNRENYDYPLFRHKPRIKKEKKIAAAEIHKDLITEKYAGEFNFEVIKKNILTINNIHFLSYANQLNLSILAKQINDKGYLYKDISLRNAYDVFLLSKKTNAKKAFVQFNKLFNPINCFLSICFTVFNEINSLDYIKNQETSSYIKTFRKSILDDSYREKFNKKLSKKLFIKARVDFIIKSFSSKVHRKWILKRVTDKIWLYEKLIQFGLKKPKPNV